MEDTRYFSRSWAMLTRDRGWYKPILVLAAANLVPIAGALGTKGYGLEWARLTAWGVDAAPKQKDVKVGKCIGSGWRGFVVDLGWGLLFFLAMLLVGICVGVIFGFLGSLGDLISGLVSLASTVLSTVFVVFLLVAEVRAAIYERIGAGFGFSNLFEMIKRDTKGFFKLVLISFVSSLAVMLVVSIAMALIGLMFAPALVAAYMSSSGSYNALMTMGASFVMALPLLVIFGYALSVVGSGLSLVLVNAVGLWMRQFNVPEWGRSEDPLPTQGYDASQGRVPQHPSADTTTYEHYEQPEQSAYDHYVPRDVPQETQQEGAQPKIMPVVVRPADQQTDGAPYERAESQETLILPQVEPEQAVEPEAEPAFVADEQEDVDPTVIFGLESESEPEGAPAPEPTVDPEPAPEPWVTPESEDAATQILEPVTPATDPQDDDDQSAIEDLYEDFLTVVKESDKTDD